MIVETFEYSLYYSSVVKKLYYSRANDFPFSLESRWNLGFETEFPVSASTLKSCFL